MLDENPYIAPAPDSTPNYDVPSEARIWRSGKLLIVEHGARLPPRCIHCNSDQGVEYLQRKLEYRPFWPLQQTHRVRLEFGYCSSCLWKRRAATMLAYLLITLGIATFAGIDDRFFLFGWMLISAGGMVKYWTDSPRATKIDFQTITINGVGSRYLEQFPVTP